MEKSERFGLVLSPDEKVALQDLADRERLSQGAVLRRLIWTAANERAAQDLSREELEVARKLRISPQEYLQSKEELAR